MKARIDDSSIEKKNDLDRTSDIVFYTIPDGNIKDNVSVNNGNGKATAQGMGEELSPLSNPAWIVYIVRKEKVHDQNRKEDIRPGTNAVYPL